MTKFDQRGQQVELQINIANNSGDAAPPVPVQRPRRTTCFVGREVELRQLLSNLSPGKIISLCGPGGIGKTSLAIEVIWTLSPNGSPPQKFPDGIIFYKFSKYDEANEALKYIAKSFDDQAKDPTIRDAQRILPLKKALLILDAAEEIDNLESILALASNCGVLITSRIRLVGVNFQCLDLTLLPSDKAVKLLQAWGKDRATSPTIAEKVCKSVDYLPLGIVIAGHYIAQYEEDIVDYLEWLQDSPMSALDQETNSFPKLMDFTIGKLSLSAHQTLGVIGALPLSSLRRNDIAKVLRIPVLESGRFLGELVKHGLLLRAEKTYEVHHALIHTYAQEYIPLSKKIASQLRAAFFRYTNSKGQTYYLHTKVVSLSNGRQQRIYFFTRNIREGNLDSVPMGYQVMETKRVGMPVLARRP